MIDNFFTEINLSISLADLIFQLTISVSALFLALLVAKLNKVYWLRKIDEVFQAKKAKATAETLLKYLNPLFEPLLVIIFLGFAWPISKHYLAEAELITLFMQLGSIWLIINFVRVFSESTMLSIVIGTILVSNVFLKILGVLDPIAAQLDSLAIDLGNIRLSVLSITKLIAYSALVVWIANLLIRFVHYYLSFLNVRVNIKSLMNKISEVVIYFIAFLVFLKLVDIDITAFAVLGGAIGVGIGLGLQKIASNFIGGFILLFEGAIKIGDVVELADGTFGNVKNLGARGTIVESFNGKEIIIPNDDFITKNVVNWTHSSSKARIDILVGVSYDSDLELVKKIILEAANEAEACMDNPAAKVYLVDFADSAVMFKLLFWVKNIKDGLFTPKSEVMFNIWNKFKEHNIEIPFPQRDLHIKSDVNKE